MPVHTDPIGDEFRIVAYVAMDIDAGVPAGNAIGFTSTTPSLIRTG